MTQKTAIVTAAILGLLGVAAGAFGAHGLEDSVSAHALATWKTGAHYQQVHAVALLALSVAAGPWTSARRGAVWAFVVGMCVFAGTLYGLTLGGPRWLGAITPIGGLSLMVGWALTAVWAVRDRPAERPDN